MDTERDAGRTIITSNDFVRKLAQRTHNNAINAFVREQPSNAITHTPGPHSVQRIFLVSRDGKSIASDYGLVHVANSDACKYLNKENPYDGSLFETMMDLGRSSSHTVVGDSQFNTGIKNCDYMHADNPHSERIFYEASSKQGVSIIFTMPIHDEMATRSSFDSDCNKVYSLGFKIHAEDGVNKISFYRGSLIPQHVQTFLMHSRLAGEVSSDGFDIGKAKKAYSDFLLERVVGFAESPYVPYSMCFLYFIDLEHTTYKDPATGQLVQSYKNHSDDITFTLRTETGTKILSMRSLVTRVYRIPECAVIREWQSVNGHKLGDISDHDIAVVVGDKATPVQDPCRGVKPVWSTNAVRNMTNDNLLYNTEFQVPSIKEQDAASLEMNPKKLDDTLPVTVYFFNSEEAPKVTGMFTMWRDRVHTNSMEQSKSLLTLQHTPLTEKTLYGINNPSSKRDVFMSFCTALPFEIQEDQSQGGKGRIYFDKQGAADFKAVLGIHPSVFLYRLEAWATSSRERANDARMRFYMLDIITCIQAGNLPPNYNKDGMSDGQDRWKLIRQNAIIAWMKYMVLKFPAVGCVEDARAAGLDVCKYTPAAAPAAAAASASASTSEPAHMPAASDPVGGTSMVLSSGLGKRRAGSAPVSANKKANPNTNDGIANTKACCELVVKLCDQFMGVTKKYAQDLQRDDPSSPSLEACNKRVLRLLSLRREAENENCGVLVNATNSTMRVKVNIERVAYTQVFFTVLNGKKHRDLMKLDRDSLEKLFAITDGNDLGILKKALAPRDHHGYLQTMLDEDNLV